MQIRSPRASGAFVAAITPFIACAAPSRAFAEPPRTAEMSGYMLVPVERAPEEFNAGFSLYAAAWPVLERYPGQRFQTGLFGTWMFAQYAKDGDGGDGKPGAPRKPKDLYSDIEGGLGWWRDTRFATATPKFIMGGVAPNFSAWANGPGAGKGRDWDRPLGKYAIAQLSPWVVWPPDGLNLAQGTCGELFGYGYLPLPFVDAKPANDAAPRGTGDQCWTLFLNTANFKGPLCFFTPHFWASASPERDDLAGALLDTRPSDPNKAFQMETQWVPAAVSAAADGGAQFGRVAPMSFPVDAEGRTVVLHRLTVYRSAALTDAVRAWFKGGPAATGAVASEAAFVQSFGKGGGSTWRLFADGTPKDDRSDLEWRRFGTPTAHDAHTFGYAWNKEFVQPVEDGRGARVRLPEYFRLEQPEVADAGKANGKADGKNDGKNGGKNAGKKPRWTAVARDEVPAATGLHEMRFDAPEGGGGEPGEGPGEGPYVTPDAPDSPFRAPGPVAGPFETTLGDGSTVTYAWYRFADQPAMLNAGLTDAEREEAQRRVELLHRAWTRDREYLAPPTTGSLASLDPALIVTPPKGLEVGYVPIALRQGRKATPAAGAAAVPGAAR